jgi:hypothetical protein
MSDIAAVRSANAILLAWTAARHGEMECGVLTGDCVTPCEILVAKGLAHCTWNTKTGDTRAVWDISKLDTPTDLEMRLYKMASGVQAIRARLAQFKLQQRAWDIVYAAIIRGGESVIVEFPHSAPSEVADYATIQMNECGYRVKTRSLGTIGFATIEFEYDVICPDK